MKRSLVIPALVAGSLAIAVIAAPVSAEQQALVWNADDPDLEWVDCPGFIPDGCRIAVLQGDPAGNNADIFFRLPPGTFVPYHWHTSAERMILVSGQLEVDYDGQEPVTLRPGSYAYGPAGLPHTAHCLDGADDCVLFIAFEEPVDAVPTEPAQQ